jgi:hypothetical protein
LVQFPTAAGDISVLPVSEAHARVQEAVSPGTDGNNLTPSFAERTDAWSYTIVPAYTLMLRFFIEHRAKFVCLLLLLLFFFLPFLRHFVAVFSPF